MTCIVGLTHGGIVYMGGDSAGIYDGTWHLVVHAEPKVFRNGPFLIGFSGSFRMRDLLRWSFKPPKPPLEMDANAWDAYMATDFVNAVRQCFKEGGFARVEDQQESGGQFLVGILGRLYCIGTGFDVCRPQADYMAIGSGAQVALGALYQTPGVAPWVRLVRVLVTAEYHDAGVRRPFFFLNERGETCGYADNHDDFDRFNPLMAEHSAVLGGRHGEQA